MNRLLLGYNPDLDLFDDLPSVASVSSGPRSSGLDDELIDGTTRLLEAADRHALPDVLVSVLRGAVPSGRRRLDRAIEAELLRLLRPAAHALLSGPSLSAAQDRAGRASRLFGIELEGLSPEDQAFESARRFLRLLQSVADHASRASPQWPPVVAARLALSRAARRLAPGWAATLCKPSVHAGRPPRHPFTRGVHHA